MARHHQFGETGEKLAATWLEKNNHQILDRNWKHPHGEIDIITLHNKIYHFVEIKTGSTNKYGYPETRAGKSKLRHTLRAASAWLYQHHIPPTTRTQFDVLVISITPSSGIHYTLFADVYP